MLPGVEKCECLHGHNWKIEIWLRGTPNKSGGMIVNVNYVKWVVERLDHKFLLPLHGDVIETTEDAHGERYVFNGCIIPSYMCYPLPLEYITAEALAQYLHDTIIEELRNKGIHVFARIRVWESEKMYVEVGELNPSTLPL